jgi:hypothetical protein
LLAAVVERMPDGRPSRLALPGRPPTSWAGLYLRSSSGHQVHVATVDASGRIRPDDLGGQAALARLGPGSRFVAAVDGRGRVVAVAGIAPKEPRAKRKAETRSTDRYAHDPHEVFIAGSAGWVLGAR